MSSSAYNLVCPACGLVLANMAGCPGDEVGIIAYAHRVYVARHIAAVQCACGCSQMFEKGFVLPHGWQTRAERIGCATEGCKATHGQRVGDLIIASHRGRVFVAHELLYIQCDECATSKRR